MRLGAAFNGRLVLVLAASLLVAVVVVATTLYVKFGETTALQPNSTDTPAGAVGSTAVVIPVAAEDPAKGKPSQSLDLSFTGPFAPGGRINPNPIATSWLKILRIDARPECLNLEYGAARPELNFNLDIHFFVTVTDAKGRVHILMDEARNAPGPRTDVMAGAIGVSRTHVPTLRPCRTGRRLSR